MVKKRPLRAKFAKRACSLCGYYNKNKVISISREREHRNSILICKACADELKAISDITFAESYTCPKCTKEFATEKGLAIHISKCKVDIDDGK